MYSRSLSSSCPTSWRSALLGVVVVIALVSPSRAQDSGLDRPEMESWASERLPALLTALASELFESESLVADQLEMGMGILEVAVSLNPDFLPAWEKQLQVGTAVQDDLENAEVYTNWAIENIVRLDPGNHVARFRQILGRINASTTAESRLKQFDVFLSPRAVEAIGPAIAARLSFDKALLHQRMGDTAAYAKALAYAVELDPSFPQATATAAGFFRVVATEASSEVELLLAAITADPLNGTLSRTLGQLLLAQGAYEGASEVLPLSLELTSVRSLNRAMIIEDTVLALWGDGQIDAAFAVLQREHRLRSTLLLTKRQHADPLSDRHEFLKTDPPAAPRFAVLKAMILGSQTDTTEAIAYKPELERIFAFARAERTNDLAVAEEAEDSQKIAAIKSGLTTLKADEAWARVLLDLDLSTVPDLIDQALSEEAINEIRAEVLRGWFAYREGRLEDARAIFTPILANTAYARAGLALVDLAEGNQQRAARTLLELYRDAPGASLGLWSRYELARLLGRSISPLEQGQSLSRLALTLPHSVHRLIETPLSTLSSSVSALKNPMSIEDPFLVRVKLRNTSGIPLTIGTGCPVGPTFALVCEVVVVGAPDLVIEPVIVSTERVFQIPANGEVTYDLNLSATSLGLSMEKISLPGATIRLRSIFNYLVVENNITKGLLGEESISVPIRLNGAMEGDDARAQLQSFIQEMQDTSRPKTLAEVGVLAQYLTLTFEWVDPFRNVLTNLIIEQFDQAGINGMAWLLTQIPPLSERFTRLIDRAIAVNDPVIFAVLLSRWVSDPGDAAIVIGRDSDSPSIRRMAELAKGTAELLELLQKRQFNLGDESN